MLPDPLRERRESPWTDAIDPPASLRESIHESRGLEPLQMLNHRRPRDGELTRELSRRRRVSREPLKYHHPHRMPEQPELV
jgi:hypothetical protein